MQRSFSELSIRMTVGVAVGLLACVFTSECNAEPLIIERSVIVEGNSEWDWTQARTAFVTADPSLGFTTMSKTQKVGAHGYFDVYFTLSNDIGKTWEAPRIIPALKRAKHKDDYEVVAGDLWPTWHQKTRKILITGKTFNFAEGTKENYLREKTCYAVFDPVLQKCTSLKTVTLPSMDHAGYPMIAPNAGCNQPFVLVDGDVLLPIRYQRKKEKRNYTSIVARCRFDGEELHYLEHGSEHSVSSGRGLYEPSVIQYRNQYFLTMRADSGAYVAKGNDGVHYSGHLPWFFDDGIPLGSYNTQQHWAVLDEKLYLIYTRRGAGNDHIFRHRAPLFIAQVDPEKLQVIRSTEQILVPEDHATLGNSGVCLASQNEVWVTVAEGRVSYGKRKGEPNRVFLVKIKSR